jgi:hypothetical protein
MNAMFKISTTDWQRALIRSSNKRRDAKSIAMIADDNRSNIYKTYFALLKVVANEVGVPQSIPRVKSLPGKWGNGISPTDSYCGG